MVLALAAAPTSAQSPSPSAAPQEAVQLPTVDASDLRALCMANG